MIAICPVCQGKGSVPAGFYFGFEGTASVGHETCRSCEGRGYIIIPPVPDSSPWKIRDTITVNDYYRGN